MARWTMAIGTIAVGALLVSACGFGVTGSSDELTDVSARLSGVVGNTKADTTKWWFEYGPTIAYGKTTTRGVQRTTRASPVEPAREPTPQPCVACRCDHPDRARHSRPRLLPNARPS
jgi:hypothetical protein